MIEHFYDSIEEVYKKRMNDTKINDKEFNKV